MNLIGRDRRSLEQGESNMAEDALLGLTCREIFSCHKTEVGSGSAEGQTVAFIVRSHASETGTAGNLPFKVEDVGQLYIGLGRLVVIAILVQPRDGKRARAAIKRT